MTSDDRQLAPVRQVLEPVLAELGLELFDLELSGAGKARTLRVAVDRDGGVDLDTITAATQAVAAPLDACEQLSGPYLLEVSSPGIERPLRRPEHFARAIGATVSIRHRADGVAQRVRGTLTGADADACTVEVDGEVQRIAYDSITQARTVFEWGPAPRAPRPSRGRRRQQESTRS
ncbi:MAG TPA: ribosome maturation factor RimP [Acidimicrobiia bacterium]|nr:ribosome maturation factor RimP [Acidimicrobiia bacterium]